MWVPVFAIDLQKTIERQMMNYAEFKAQFTGQQFLCRPRCVMKSDERRPINLKDHRLRASGHHQPL